MGIALVRLALAKPEPSNVPYLCNNRQLTSDNFRAIELIRLA